MAIQMRRGNQVDFNPSNMLPGEWAISQDNEKVYMCFSAGRVMEIGSASAIMPYVEEAEAWAKGTKDGEPVTSEDAQYHNNSKYYSDHAQYIVDSFEEQFPHASTERPTGASYVILTVTDVGGSTETKIYDGPEGPEGPEGYSPEVSISTISGGHRVTITDEDHPSGQSFDVLDGAGNGDMTKTEYASNGATGVVDAAVTLSGLNASIEELNYVDGVTSAIQTQLNSKADTTAVSSKLTGKVFGTATSVSGTSVTFNNIDTTKGYELEADLGTTWDGPLPNITNVAIASVGTSGAYSVTYTLSGAVANQTFRLIEIG